MFKKNNSKIGVQKMTVETNDHPLIVIKYEALVKMKYYIDNCEKEIGWLGKSKKTSKNTYLIEDVYLIEQKVSGVTTELDENAMMEFFREIKETHGIAEVQNIRVWGHSHVNMGVYASGQDDETFAEYYGDCNYFIRIIANKKGDMKIDLADKEVGLIYYNLPWSVEYSEELVKIVEQINALEAELKELRDTANKELEKYTPDEAQIKNEIKRKVEEERYSIVRGGNKNKDKDLYQDYYNYYGYGWYDNDDMPVENTYNTTQEDVQEDKEYEYYEYLYKSLDEGTIPVSTAPNTTTYKKITDLFEPYEIEEIVNCGSRREVKELLSSDSRFAKYSNKDWTRLKDKCEELLLAVIDAEEVS